MFSIKWIWRLGDRGGGWMSCQKSWPICLLHGTSRDMDPPAGYHSLILVWFSRRLESAVQSQRVPNNQKMGVTFWCLLKFLTCIAWYSSFMSKVFRWKCKQFSVQWQWYIWDFIWIHTRPTYARSRVFVTHPDDNKLLQVCSNGNDIHCWIDQSIIINLYDDVCRTHTHLWRVWIHFGPKHSLKCAHCELFYKNSLSIGTITSNLWMVDTILIWAVTTITWCIWQIMASNWAKTGPVPGHPALLGLMNGP